MILRDFICHRHEQEDCRWSRLFLHHLAVFPNNNRQAKASVLDPQLARRPAMGAEGDLSMLGKFVEL